MLILMQVLGNALEGIEVEEATTSSDSQVQGVFLIGRSFKVPSASVQVN